MRKNKGMGTVLISTTVSHEFWEKAQKYQISWAEAMRKGLSIMFSEKGDPEAQNPRNYERKIEAMAAKLSEFVEQNASLQEELKKIKKKF